MDFVEFGFFGMHVVFSCRVIGCIDDSSPAFALYFLINAYMLIGKGNYLLLFYLLHIYTITE